MVLARNQSYGSDTYTGMEVTAILASVVQSTVRQSKANFLPTF